MFTSSFTGIGRYVFELTQNLAKLDHETEFVCFLNPREFAQFQAPAPNFRAVKVQARHYSFAEQTTFLQALKRERLDLMHFTHFNAPLLYPRPTVVTIHDLILSFFPGKKMNQWYHRLAYNLVLRRAVQHAQKIITVSQNTKQDLQKVLGTPSQKICVVLNGLSKKFSSTHKQASKIVSQKFGLENYLLTTGVSREHKNLPRLLQTLAYLRKTQNFSGKLVLTGPRDSLYTPTIIQLIQQLKLEKSVVVLGLVSEEDLQLLLEAARVFVFPSLYEGFGLPPLESMAAGTPVVASATSSLPEVCGQAAEFFDPYKLREMAAKIFQVWHFAKLRARLISAGYQQIQKFNWQKTAQETYAVYQQALPALKKIRPNANL